MKKNSYILVCLIFVFSLLTVSIIKAETIDELQEKIDRANKSREQLQEEIDNYQNQLKVIADQAVTLQNNIKSLDVSTNKISTEVKLTQTNISKTTYTIEDTGLEIKNREQQINIGKQAITKALKQVNEADFFSIWEILLSNLALSDFWTEIDNIIQIQAKIGDEITEVRDIKAKLELAKTELEERKKELVDYTDELNNKKQILLNTKKEKNNLLTTTKNTESNYQKILKEKLALKEALDAEINSYESQLKYAIDPQSYPKAGKGILAWPLDYVYITQYFGKTADSGRLYVSGSHNGVDFRAPIGTRVKSPGNGVVEAVGDTDPICPGASYGKWVFIRYDNGLASAFGHLSLISAKSGQRVKTGDVVGYSGSTGYSTGPHLHLSVFAGQGVKVSTLKSTVCKGTYTIPLADPKAYLDPMIYL